MWIYIPYYSLMTKPGIVWYSMWLFSVHYVTYSVYCVLCLLLLCNDSIVLYNSILYVLFSMANGYQWLLVINEKMQSMVMCTSNHSNVILMYYVSKQWKWLCNESYSMAIVWKLLMSIYKWPMSSNQCNAIMSNLLLWCSDDAIVYCDLMMVFWCLIEHSSGDADCSCVILTLCLVRTATWQLSFRSNNACSNVR